MKHQDLLQTRLIHRVDLGDSSYVVHLEKKSHFTPGQVIGLTVDPAEPLRYYSLCSGADQDPWEVLFKIVPEGRMTNFLATVPLGTEIWCTPPQGTFIQRPGKALWIAGGTGVAPFLSMVRSGIRQPLIQGGRTLDALYFRDYLGETLGELYQGCCSTTGTPGVSHIRLIDHLKARSYDPEVNYYLCGSAALVVEVRDLLISRSVPYDRIYSEIYF